MNAELRSSSAARKLAPASSLFLRSRQSARRQVAEHVRTLLATGRLQRGDRLPTYHEFCAQLGVSYVTVKGAMDALAEEGLVHRIPSKGTFVSKEIAPRSHALSRLGIIMPTSRDYLFQSNFMSEILRGVMLQANTGDVDVLLFSLSRDGMVMANDLAGAGVDGVLLLCMENDEYLRAFAGWGTPGVVVDYRPDAAPLDCLVCDNAGGVRRAMEYLAGLGHRRIAYVDSPQQGLVRYRYDLNHPLLSRLSSDRVERRTAFQEALATLGLGSGNDGGWLPESTGDSWGNMRLVAEQWRAAAVRPSAFLVYDDIHALDLLGQLAAVGARAPQDVSVCAVAGAAGAAFEGRPLAYSCFNFIDMGRQAVRILQTRCQCPDGQPLAVHRIGFQFIEGATAGKAGE